jgi:hypothetical protein
MRLWILASLTAVSLFADARITVEVIYDGTRAPLEGVTLRFFAASDQTSFEILALTDSHGRAEVKLKPGQYILEGNRNDLGLIYYMPLVDNWVREVVVRPDDESQSITFLVSPLTTLTGTIRDETGNPMANVMVQLHEPKWSDGRLSLTPTFSNVTDDRGVYTIHIRSGNYVLCAQPQSTEPRPVPVLGLFDFAAPPPSLFYGRTCIPTSEPDADGMIHLNPGDTVSSDLVLQSSRGVDIHGRLSASVFTNVSLVRRKVASGQRFYAYSNSGEFIFHGIPHGEYRMEAQASIQVGQATEQRYASLDIDASGASIEVPEFKLEKRPTVQLSFEEESSGLAQNITEITLINAIREFVPLAPGQPTEARSGEMWLRHTTSGNVCITGVALDDKSVFRQKFFLTAGSSHRLVVRLSRRCISPLDIQVSSNGDPVPFPKIVFLLSGTVQSPAYVYETVADPEGKFTLTGIAPGRYLAWAWSDTTLLKNDPHPYVGPTDLASVGAKATVLDVTEDKGPTIKIPILNPPRQ